MLLYADDIGLFASSPLDVNRKLEVLDKYCQENSLHLNTEDNKSIGFSTGAEEKKTQDTIYNCVRLKYEKYYVYLEIPFSNTGIFKDASEYFIRTAMLDAANVNKILPRSNSEPRHKTNQLWKLYYCTEKR